jgi:hypothetical protein
VLFALPFRIEALRHEDETRPTAVTAPHDLGIRQRRLAITTQMRPTVPIALTAILLWVSPTLHLLQTAYYGAAALIMARRAIGAAAFSWLAAAKYPTETGSLMSRCRRCAGASGGKKEQGPTAALAFLALLAMWFV